MCVYMYIYIHIFTPFPRSLDPGSACRHRRGYGGDQGGFGDHTPAEWGPEAAAATEGEAKWLKTCSTQSHGCTPAPEPPSSCISP